MERRFLKLNWHDIKTRDKAIDKLILPIGTVEAHGITMTGTDVMIPESLSNDMADDLNAFVLPTMPYGITSSLLPYSGSIDISAEALKRIVLDIAHSVIKDNFKYLIIMNGHGGNNNALSVPRFPAIVFFMKGEPIPLVFILTRPSSISA